MKPTQFQQGKLILQNERNLGPIWHRLVRTLEINTFLLFHDDQEQRKQVV